MAIVTSGTATFNLDIVDICEEAYERAGMEMRSGYDLKSARRSLSVMALEWANRGLNLWTVREASIALVSGTATYNLPADVIDIMEQVIRTGTGATQSDFTVSRMTASTYAALAAKNTAGRPTQGYINRQTDNATVTLWPVPDDSIYTYQYWAIRRIEDLGVNTNGFDAPERFVPALVAGLAYYIAMKRPEVERRVPVLKAIYEEQFELAASEDRTKTPLVFTPLSDYITL